MLRWAVPVAFVLSSALALAGAPFTKVELYRKGREMCKRGELVRAAAAFEDVIRAEEGRSTVQLAVVCDANSIARMVDSGGSEDGFYFISVEVEGRPCFKALWGIYPDGELARSAIAAIPEGLKDSGSPPIPVAVSKLLAPPPPPPPTIVTVPDTSPRAGATATSVSPPARTIPTRPAPPRRTVFTDEDLSKYRSARERDEEKYGKPKPLFETVNVSEVMDGEKEKKGSGDAESAPTTVTTHPAPGDESGYWRSLADSARRTIERRRDELAQAEESGDEAAVSSARQELARAEDALEDLKTRARERGADPSWLQ